MMIRLSLGPAWTERFPPALQQPIVPEQNITIDKCKHLVPSLPPPAHHKCVSKQIPTAPLWTTPPPKSGNTP